MPKIIYAKKKEGCRLSRRSIWPALIQRKGLSFATRGGLRHRSTTNSKTDRQAKNDLYIGCIAKKEHRLFFPVDLAEQPPAPDVQEFMDELCAEELIEDSPGRLIWPAPPRARNRYAAPEPWGKHLLPTDTLA